MHYIQQLWPSHMIRTMVEEHEVILANLSKLRELVLEMRKSDKPSDQELDLLKTIGDNLLAAEPHHKREEDVLFAELEDLGIEGPPTVMRMEHVELRKLKHQLAELSGQADDLEPGVFISRVEQTALTLVGMLEAHIDKENNILYPCALAEIDEETWVGMHTACEVIGPCDFKPLPATASVP